MSQEPQGPAWLEVCANIQRYRINEISPYGTADTPYSLLSKLSLETQFGDVARYISELRRFLSQRERIVESSIVQALLVIRQGQAEPTLGQLDVALPSGKWDDELIADGTFVKEIEHRRRHEVLLPPTPADNPGAGLEHQLAKQGLPIKRDTLSGQTVGTFEREATILFLITPVSPLRF
jgi:hypothetical protein